MRILYRVSLQIILLIILMTACLNDSGSNQPSPTPDSWLVYNTIYNIVVSDLYPEAEAFIVMDRTDPRTDLGRNFKLNGVEEETVAHFLTENEYASLIDQGLQLDSEVTFTNYHSLARRFGTGDPQFWLDIVSVREAYPNVAGILRFSRIGFNPEMDQALLEFSFEWGACTKYHFIVLNRDKDSWEIQDHSAIEECG